MGINGSSTRIAIIIILTPEVDFHNSPEFPWEFVGQDRHLSQMAPVVPAC